MKRVIFLLYKSDISLLRGVAQFLLGYESKKSLYWSEKSLFEIKSVCLLINYHLLTFDIYKRSMKNGLMHKNNAYN